MQKMFQETKHLKKVKPIYIYILNKMKNDNNIIYNNILAAGTVWL